MCRIGVKHSPQSANLFPLNNWKCNKRQKIFADLRWWFHLETSHCNYVRLITQRHFSIKRQACGFCQMEETSAEAIVSLFSSINVHNFEALCGFVQITSLSHRVAEFKAKRETSLGKLNGSPQISRELFRLFIAVSEVLGRDRTFRVLQQTENFFPCRRSCHKKAAKKFNLLHQRNVRNMLIFPLLKSGRGDEEKKSWTITTDWCLIKLL